MYTLTGISMVDRKNKDTGKLVSYLVYHLGTDATQGIKHFYDFWSRDAVNGVKIGDKVDVELSMYDGNLRVSGIKTLK